MSGDEQAIKAIIGRLIEAWNAGDSQTFASQFAEDACFIHIYGGQLDGRPAIEAAHRTIFDTIYKGSHNEYTLQGIRFLRPDVAIVLIRAHLKFYEGGQPREFHTRPTLIAVKENGKWQAVAFQNTRISEMPPIPKATSG